MVDPIRIPMDKAGRVVLPKALREHLRLRPGSRLEVEVHEDHVRLRPVDRDPVLRQVEGWWVHQGTADSSLELANAVARHRRERLEDTSR